MWRFEATSRKATPKGQPSSLAQHRLLEASLPAHQDLRSSFTAHAPAKSRFVAIVRQPQVVARCFATALVQAGSQISATGTFGHLVQTATLPGPWGHGCSVIPATAA